MYSYIYVYVTLSDLETTRVYNRQQEYMNTPHGKALVLRNTKKPGGRPAATPPSKSKGAAYLEIRANPARNRGTRTCKRGDAVTVCGDPCASGSPDVFIQIRVCFSIGFRNEPGELGE